MVGSHIPSDRSFGGGLWPHDKWYHSQPRSNYNVSPNAPTGGVARGFIYDEGVTWLSEGECHGKKKRSHIVTHFETSITECSKSMIDCGLGYIVSTSEVLICGV